MVTENYVPKCVVNTMIGKNCPQAQSGRGIVNKQINILAVFLVEAESL